MELNQPIPVDASELALQFGRWLAVLQRGQPASKSSVGCHDQPHDEEIYLESGRGSTGEVAFEGVLHFDGHTVGNIRSPRGTLVLTKHGRVEADIDVGVAVISGSVTGNINASEFVVLDNDARVAGQISTRCLSVRLGALFEGDCLFIAPSEANGSEHPIKEVVKHSVASA